MWIFEANTSELLESINPMLVMTHLCVLYDMFMTHTGVYTSMKTTEHYITEHHTTEHHTTEHLNFKKILKKYFLIENDEDFFWIISDVVSG